MEKVIVLTGPTGIGKTELSLKLAKEFDLEIINADASQMKRDLLIGTGKYDVKGTSIKHHLFDIIEPNENYSIKDFSNSAKKIITSLNDNGSCGFIVGGTGLYINSLLYDYDLNNLERSGETENKYFTLSNHELHQVLEKLDPNFALTIHENNRRRVLRAIERLEKGEAIIDNDVNIAYDALVILLDTDRSTLYDRINKRVDKMFLDGWVDECKMLLSKYDVTNIKDIGYQEIFSYLKGEKSLEETKELIKKKTRNYAKRQLTWFRNKLDHKSVLVNYDNIDETYDELAHLVRDFINK